MPAWIKNFVRFAVFGNIWVAFAATCLYWETVLLHDLPFHLPLSVSIFGATLFIYNYHRLFRKKAIYSGEQSERHQWIVANQNVLTALAIIALALSVTGFLPYLNLKLVLRFAPFILLAALYVIPVWKKNGKWIRLRDFPFLKIFLVAAVWAFVTVFLPFLANDPDWLPNASAWLTLVHRFLFIFAITMPFDIRDLVHDKEFGVVTFASQLGILGLKMASRIMIVGVAVCGVFGYLLEFYAAGHVLGLIISAASTGWLISRGDENSDEWYYVGWLDGSMVDQLFWVWLMGVIL